MEEKNYAIFEKFALLKNSSKFRSYIFILIKNACERLKHLARQENIN